MCGCDGAIRVKGKVYAKKSAEGESAAYVDEAHSVDPDLVPLEGATITLFGTKDYSTRKPDKEKDMNVKETADKTGYFDIGHMTSPFRFRAALMVEKDGYKPVMKLFQHDKLEHEAVIILIPVEKAKAQNPTN
jgi:hypothetical protein